MFVQNIFGSKAVFLSGVRAYCNTPLERPYYFAPHDCSWFAFVALFYYV